jgi:hypothetical protein
MKWLEVWCKKYGTEGSRTPGLLNANQALYQLSYCPQGTNLGWFLFKSVCLELAELPQAASMARLNFIQFIYPQQHFTSK